jgi:hypothetical protein
MSTAETIELVAIRAAERAVRAILAEYAAPVAEYLNTNQAATYLNLSPEYLEIARHKADGSGPDYTKLPRAVRYRRADLDAWMTKQRVKAA